MGKRGGRNPAIQPMRALRVERKWAMGRTRVDEEEADHVRNSQMCDDPRVEGTGGSRCWSAGCTALLCSGMGSARVGRFDQDREPCFVTSSSSSSSARLSSRIPLQPTPLLSIRLPALSTLVHRANGVVRGSLDSHRSVVPTVRHRSATTIGRLARARALLDWDATVSFCILFCHPHPGEQRGGAS